MKNKSTSLSANDRKLIGVLCMLIVYGNVNITMFNLAVPSIAQSFTLSSSQVSWIMVGYSIIMAVGAGTYSKLAESFSFRRLYVIGLLLIFFGSLVGYFASSFIQVIIGRLIQAAGASSISPLSYAIATRFFDYHIRGRVLGTLSATIAFASGFGPVLGGFIEEYAGWHALFLVSSSCLFVLPFVLKHIHATEHHQEHFDVIGMMLFSAGMAFLIVGVTTNLLFGLVGLGVLGSFWIHINRTIQPFISANLLKTTHYRSLLWIALMTFLCNTGLIFMLPMIMKSVFHMPMGKIGMLMIPSAVSAALLGSAIGNWSDQYGSLRILMISQGLVIIGFVLLSFSIYFTPLMISFLIIIPIIGFNGILTTSGKLISLAIKQSELGMGMGVFSLFYLLGGAFGPALIGRLLDLNMPFGAVYIILAIIGLLSFSLTLLSRGTDFKGSGKPFTVKKIGL